MTMMEDDYDDDHGNLSCSHRMNLVIVLWYRCVKTRRIQG
jgi:hypothetical protein